MKLNLSKFILLFISFTGYSQNQRAIQPHKYLDLEAISEFSLKISANSIDKKIKFFDEELGVVTFNDGDFQVAIDGKRYSLEPESYNIGISLLKDSGGRIIGMTKKYDRVHLIGIDKEIYRIRYLDTGQIILNKLNENDPFTEPKTTKVIRIAGHGKQMEIFHNVDKIPVVLIPTILNTRKIDKKIAGKVAGSALLSGALLALRIITDAKSLK